jgi:hypothetical protein
MPTPPPPPTPQKPKPIIIRDLDRRRQVPGAFRYPLQPPGPYRGNRVVAPGAAHETVQRPQEEAIHHPGIPGRCDGLTNRSGRGEPLSDSDGRRASNSPARSAGGPGSADSPQAEPPRAAQGRSCPPTFRPRGAAPARDWRGEWEEPGRQQDVDPTPDRSSYIARGR